MNFEIHAFMFCSVIFISNLGNQRLTYKTCECHKVGKLSKHTGKDEKITKIQIYNLPKR